MQLKTYGYVDVYYTRETNNHARLTDYDGNVNTNISIYPNPTKGIFTIEIENINETESFIHIYNNIGILLYKEKMGNKNKFPIDLSTFTNGLYQIEIIQGETINFKKIIKI